MKRLFYGLPVLLWLGVIWFLSSQPYQEQSIVPLLKKGVSLQQARDVLPDVTFHYGSRIVSSQKNPYGFMEFLLRKGAHLFVYGILAALGCLALARVKMRFWQKAVLALLFVGFVASWDEWNQLRSAERTGNYRDVVMDLGGGCLGIVLIVAGGNIRRLLARGERVHHCD